MLGWLLSLLLSLLISAGAWLPGRAEADVAQELVRLTGARSANVTVAADPLFQLPLGHIPRVRAHLAGYPVAGVPAGDLELELRDVRLDPLRLIASRDAVLVAPAPVRLSYEATAQSLHAAVHALEQRGAFAELPVELALFGRKLGPLTLSELSVGLAPERVAVKGLATLGGTPFALPFEVSARPVVVGERRIGLVEPRVLLNRRPLPEALVASELARLQLDLDTLALPGRDWRFAGLTVGPGGLRVGATGTLTALPAKAGPR